MITKIIGASVLIISSGVYGIYNANQLEKRLAQLKDLRAGLSFLKQEIYLTGVPLGKAMENTSTVMKTEIKTLFLECGKAISLNNGVSVQEQLLSYMNERDILLCDQSKNILSRWASTAGNGDRKAELENLDYAISQLDQLIISNEEDYAKKSRLYKSCGFLIGAFLVAVLL